MKRKTLKELTIKNNFMFGAVMCEPENYTFANQCLEDLELNQNDGCRTIFLSTFGENEAEVPEGMVNFLKFVKADLAESEQDFGPVPAEIHERILTETDTEKLRVWLKLAAKAESMEQFLKNM